MLMTRRKPDSPDATSKLLQTAVRRSRMTLRQIAEKAGVDVGIVSRFARGQRAVTVGTAHEIARALGLRFRLVRRSRKRTARRGRQ
jgi:transcriptional regulator with XRE-family HTH domain